MFNLSNLRSVFRERQLKVQAPELPPAMRRFLPRSPEVSIQVPGSTSHTKPELSVPEKSQETTKAQPITTTSTPFGQHHCADHLLR